MSVIKKMVWILLGILWAVSAWSAVADNPETAYRFSVLEESASGLTIEFTLDDITIEDIDLNGTTWQNIRVEQGGYVNTVGEPDLPLVSRFVSIPGLSDVHVEVVGTHRESYSDLILAPLQTPEYEAGLGGEFTINEDLYSRNEFYPQQLVSTGDPAILRDHRVVRLTTYPVQYNPVTGQVDVYDRITVRVSFEGVNPINQKTTPPKPLTQAFAEIYRNTIINYHEPDGSGETIRGIFDPTPMPGTYLIIYPSSVENYIESFVEWKRRKGHRVFLATTAQTGTSSTAIRNYIRDAYDDWEFPPDFVLLVGDAGGSINVAASNSYGDHDYSRVEGTDVLGDIAVGRFSVGSEAELLTVVAKTVRYESMPWMNDTGWFQRGTIVAGSSYSGLSTIQTNQSVGMRLLDAGYTDLDSCWYSMGCTTVGTISSSMNEGSSYVNYRGWIGMEGWSNSNANALNNGWMTPIVTIPTCNTGTFVGSGACQTEGFLRAGSAASGGGAVAVSGLATSSTHTRYNNTICMGVYGSIFDWGLKYYGTAVFRGKYELYLSFPANSGDVSNFSSWFNEMGDPGLEVRYGIPDILEADYPTTISLGETEYHVNVTCEDDPAEGALVTLFREGELFERALTDENGDATIYLTPGYSAGDFMVTISRFNGLPILDDCTVTSDDVFVTSTLGDVDDTAGDSSGDINPGENVTVYFDMQNLGDSETATGVSVDAAMDEMYGTIEDVEVTASDIAAGEMVEGMVAVTLQMSPDLEFDQQVILNLTVTTDQGEFTPTILLPIDAPHLEFVEIDVDDANGSLDPGEIGEVTVLMENVGSKSLYSAEAIIHTDAAFVTLIDSVGTYTLIMPGSTDDNSGDPFMISVDANAPPGYSFDVDLTWTMPNGDSQMIPFTIQVGDPGEDDPTGPDAYGYWAYENQDSDYELAPTYNWVEIVPGDGGYDGTECNLSDHGSEQDDSEIFPLPFTFIYYGEPFDEITICSNGYVAFGEYSDWFSNFRNQPMPNPQGAYNMIAPMWDDFHFNNADDAYYYYDEDGHRFIIQWDNALTNGNHSNTFELILFDPLYFPSSTGDAEFMFQYQEFFDDTSPYGWDNPYCTVGWENGNSTDGMTMSYWHYTAETANSFSGGKAVYITTSMPGLMDPPVAEITPLTIDVTMYPRDTLSQDITISNLGQLALSYSITLEERGGRDSGGPDAYGYEWRDSAEPDGPEYNWVDVSGAGEMLQFADHEQTLEDLEIGFPFRYYGTDYMNLQLNANGFVSFGEPCDGVSCWLNGELPSEDAPEGMIAPYWDDLDPTDPEAEVWYYTNHADSLIISWVNVPQYNESIEGGPFTFQLILAGNGVITWQYQSMPNAVWGTAGMQNMDQDMGFTMVYNDTYINDEMAVRVQPSFWLTADPEIGVVGMNDDATVTLFFDPGNSLPNEEGDFSAVMHILTNDPDNYHFQIPIDMHLRFEDVDDLVQVTDFYLAANYPNPFNPSTRIEFGLPTAQEVRVEIFNVQGQRVDVLASERMDAGVHQLIWNADSYAAGVYFVKVVAGNQRALQKMLLVK